MAQQMTIREQILFQNIDIDEYYHKRWEENAKRMNEQYSFHFLTSKPIIFSFFSIRITNNLVF